MAEKEEEHVEIGEDALKQAVDKKEEGNMLYKNDDLDGALVKWREGIELFGNDLKNKSLAAFYANCAAAEYKKELYEKVVEDCNMALSIDNGYIKALVRRCESYEKLHKYAEAIVDIDELIKLDGNNIQNHQRKRESLLKLKTEADEKMKEEVIGKLKDFGSSILGKFGLSLDNFKMQQDPNTGSYSVNFQQ